MTDEYPRVYLYRRMVRAKLFIDEHYHERINLNLVSEEAAFSKFHFIRLFKNLYGKTPHQYLRDVRLDKARQFLDAETLDMESVCLKVGFESVGSFSSLFKRRFRVSPAYYRELRAERKEHISEKPLNYIPGCFASAFGWTINKSNFEEVSPFEED